MNWLRGKDLNLRPLGYEFSTSFLLVPPVTILQSLPLASFVLVFAVSDCHVSNLLAIWLPVFGLSLFPAARLAATNVSKASVLGCCRERRLPGVIGTGVPYFPHGDFGGP
jgi:hypothetical protein